MKKITYISLASFLVVFLLFVAGCKKQNIKLTTTDDVNIVDYLKKYPDQFSEFIKILDRTNISPYLNAYGTYTCFAPTNNAISLYLKKYNLASTDVLDTGSLKDIVRIHLLEDTVSTRAFTDGKMPVPTQFGQYLITGVSNDNGSAGIIVNRQAIITLPNVLCGNGYVHIIDHVLEPAKLTVAKMIEANPKYSIFTQALKATGYYDSLNIEKNKDTTRRWLTVLAQTDSIFNTKGIASYAALKAKYSNTGNPLNRLDSLSIYMAYHILPNLKYLADLVSAPSHQTLAPLSVVTTLLKGQSILLNEAVFNSVFEPGTLVDRPASDNAATNGVIHSMLGEVILKKRTPYGVYFDVGDQPEIRKVSSVFRKAGKFLDLPSGFLKDVTWQNTALTFRYSVNTSTSADFYVWDDIFAFNIRTPTNQNNWIEFVTPLLVQGKYKVWMCYRRSNQGMYVQVSVDDVPLSRIVNFQQALPDVNAPEAVLESQGYKRYTNAPNTNSSQVAQLAGVVDIATTDRHRIRMTAIRDNGSSGNNLTFDMIQFIPIDLNQQYPRFRKDGTQF